MMISFIMSFFHSSLNLMRLKKGITFSPILFSHLRLLSYERVCLKIKSLKLDRAIPTLGQPIYETGSRVELYLKRV